MFNGVDLKEQYNFNVTKIDGRGSPPVSTTEIELPRVDGAIVLNRRFGKRKISISGYIYGTSISEATQKKDDLIRLISTAYDTEQKLQFPDTGRYIYVQLAGEPIAIGPVGPIFGAYAYEIFLNFEAKDPYFYGDDFNFNGAGWLFTIDADAPTYLISPRREFMKREPNITIYPVTLVNLLGVYGNFERDSNGDGLADGWSTGTSEYSRVSGVLGSYGQKLYYDNTGGTSIQGLALIRSYVYISDEDQLFARAYIKKDTSDTSAANVHFCFYCYDADGNLLDHIYNTGITSTSWQLLTWKPTLPVGTTHISVRVRELIEGGAVGSYVVDGFALYNLAAMSTLPPPLQDLYGVTNWADLDADTLAQLLPYCDGVCSIGFAWESDV